MYANIKDNEMQNYNAEKLEILYKPINISFEEITLLSEYEYFKNKKLIPPSKDYWWLCSQRIRPKYVAFVSGKSGDVCDEGIYVGCTLDVRPALRIRDCYNLIPGDKIRISGYIFTILNEKLALCDTCIGKSIFDNESDDFETSYIKQYLYDWANHNNINFKNH